MKIIKSYTAIIGGNKSKLEYLTNTLKTIQEMSDYIFFLEKDKWNNKNCELYYLCREKFPSINSNILQNFLGKYRFVTGKKLPRKKAHKSVIFISQNFNIRIIENKLTSLWLRFGRKNYPLFSRYLLEKLKNISNNQIECCQIYSENDKLYCKVFISYEVEEPISSNNPIAIDMNTKAIVSSDNKFYNMKRLFHTRYENRKKNNWKSKNISNLVKNQIHLVSNKIISDLKHQGSEVLVLEDLKFSNLKKKSYNKKQNFVFNTFFHGHIRDYLTYKCIENGIKVVKVKPEYTSKIFNKTGSLNTIRPVQNLIVCLDNNQQLHADLNASRNILDCYLNPQGFKNLHSKWATIQSSPVNINSVSSRNDVNIKSENRQLMSMQSVNISEVTIQNLF